MKYQVGQLVLNRKLGLGKVLEVHGDLLTVHFRDEKENPRTINVAVVPMDLAPEQSDPDLDSIKGVTRPKAPRKPRPKAPKKEKAKAKADDAGDEE